MFNRGLRFLAGRPALTRPARCLGLELLEARDVPATGLVNLNAAGTTQGNGDVQFLDASADGRYVLFVSTSTDLVAGQVDTVGTRDLFWRDTVTGTTVLVTAAAGQPATALGGTGFLGATGGGLGAVQEAVLSSDGLHVAYTSLVQAVRIVAGAGSDTDGTTLDAFAVDLSGGTAVTTLASVQADGTAVGDDGASVSDIAISGTGQYVSYVTNLIGSQIDPRVTMDAASTTDLFRRDTTSTLFNDPTTPATQAVSIVNGNLARLVGFFDGVQVISRANVGFFFGTSRGSYVDDTGTTYVFTTIADANDELLLSQPDRNDTFDVYSRSMGGTALTPVSLATNNELVGNTASIDSADAIISANGLSIVYATQADRTAGNVPIANLVNTSGYALIAVQGGTQKLVNRLLAPTDPTASLSGVSNYFAVSDNGTRVVFDSTDTGLATNATDGTGSDVFAFDVAAGTNQYVSVDAQNQATVGGTISFTLLDPVSADGLLIAYQGVSGPAAGTDATVTGGVAEVVVRDLAGQSSSVIATTVARDTGVAGTARGVYRASGTAGRGYFESAATGVVTSPTTGTNLYATNLPVSVTPPVADAGGPYSVSAGGSVVLSGSANNPAGGPLTYEWDLDGDGVFGETGAGATRGAEVGQAPTFVAGETAGPVTVTLRVTDSQGQVSTSTATINVTAVVSASVLALATGQGDRVDAFGTLGGSARFTVSPFGPGYAGGMRVATGDVNGDGIDDVIVGSAAGADHVKVFSGADGTLLRSFLAFGGFRGGVSVGAADVNGDGIADIIVGAGAGAVGGHVKVFDGSTGAELRSFFAFDGFNGGVSVSAGDLNGDGTDDLIVGAGAGAAGGHVKVFDGQTGAVLRSFFAFDGFAGGVSVASADVNGDGVTDLVVGTATGPSHVKAFAANGDVPLVSRLVFPGHTGGVSVAGDVNGILVGPRGVAPAHVKRLGLNGVETDSFIAFPGVNGGIEVG